MSIIGRVMNGVVVLPPGAPFPEGTEVKIESLRLGDGIATGELTAEAAANEADQLAGMSAQTSGLPPDLALNHDHYLHGLPKR